MLYSFSNTIRLARITDIDHDTGVASTQWLDQGSSPGPDIPIPHPYAGLSGEGIFIGLQTGSVIALDMASFERYIPVAIMPSPMSYGDSMSGVDDASFDAMNFPQLEEGDVVLQGIGGGQIRLNADGDLLIKTALNEGFVLGGDNSHRCSITTNAPVAYVLSQSGLSVNGIVRRDIRIEESEKDYINFLDDMSSEQVLEEVGLNPQKEVVYNTKPSSNQADKKFFRNPALIENRNIFFEFGRDWGVGTHQEELDRVTSNVIAIADSANRGERRTNVLGLSLNSPNELIEEVRGTLVDIFGNLIDINRNIIPPPKGENPTDYLDSALDKMKHTVALHLEINTRKGWLYTEEINNTKKAEPLKDAPNPFSTGNNARDRSRWFVDVDKEGLTKINIPATSETGNVPVLARYETSSTVVTDDKGNPKTEKTSDPKKLYRNEGNKDIFLDQVGPGGIIIMDGEDRPNIVNRLAGEYTSWGEDTGSANPLELPKYIETGTAFHDITQTALNLLQKSININAFDMVEKEPPTPAAGLPAISSTINPLPPAASTSVAIRNPETGLLEDQPNAGGRSLQANFDGSVEMSVGANTVDRVSFTLDTAGALVARLGRDRFGRSVVMQTDGTIALEVGGFDFIGENANDSVDARFVGKGDGRADSLPGDKTRFKSGKIVIKLRRANEAGTGPDDDPNVLEGLLILDETGMTIQSSGRLNLISEMDINIESKSRIQLEAPKVQIYRENPKFMSRDGRRG